MKKSFSKNSSLYSWLVVAVVVLSVHGVFAQSAANLNRAVITPSLANLQPGEEQKFKVVTLATRLMAAALVEDVKWSVNDIPGGNEELGMIDPTGLYRAPATVPKPCEIHICAEAEGVANRYLWGTVLLGDRRPSYKTLQGWSEPIEDSPHLDNPHGIALDADGNILIGDIGNNRVVRFSRDGEFLGDIGSGSGHKPGYFTEPRVVTVDAEGRIFVADRKSDRPRIQVFDRDGTFLRIFAEKGTGPGHILRAHGLGFGKDQRLFVVDVDNMRVNVYEHSGEFLYTFGEDAMDPGQFNAPHGLALDKNGDVFVQSYYGPCQKLTPEGKFIAAFAHGDPPDGPVYFHSLASDRWGDVYLTIRAEQGYDDALQDDEGNRVSIMKYNNNGDYITSLSLSVSAHRESWAVIDNDGLVYTLYRGKDQMGVEILKEQ
ncbi:MAG: NHL repeat-containing protein [bacterium]